MRKYLISILIFVCICINTFGQLKLGYVASMVQAGIYLNRNSMAYNTGKAFEIYKSYAEKGSARAMNCLAILYFQGIGTTTNQQEALKWFELSAEKGYPNAYYNLGNIYRTGCGVLQDFKRAYQLFEKGSKVNSSGCMYQQGYMLYKGLGVTQNYQQAIVLFRKGIIKCSSGSMYLIGLCFRNGYGIVTNIDSARYWLNKAASKGYNFANEELQILEPENISDKLSLSLANSGNTQNKSKLVPIGNMGPYKTFQRIEHVAKLTDISGEYTGFVIRYDYSGQHVIGNSTLRLKLEVSDNVITGSWVEGGSHEIKLQAAMTDSDLVFNNSVYMAPDHYSLGNPISYLFKNARLLVVREKDSVYMAGNLQLWSASRNEPEKPIYISLVRNAPVIKISSSSLDTINLKVSQVSELKVYPNPFKNSLQVCFNIKKQSLVEISIVDMTGKIVYIENPKLFTIGNYNLPIQANLKLGAYLLTLRCNGEIKSSVIVKQ